VNSAGIYVVNFFICGERVQVAVDDHFPCMEGVPVFSRSNGPQIWVMVLEKAWAKLVGNYDKA